MNKKTNNNSKLLIILAIFVFVTAVILLYINPIMNSERSASNIISKVTDRDIVIPIDEVTETPSFYPATINGTDLEIIAVKASDGTIRTAFNTCQVCYSSGRGYYKTEGDRLVCQNCGNSFSVDEVEVTRGGCNPVPITPEYKTIDDKTIIITKDFLNKATEIFHNWK